jgi:hypothetical protein
MMRRVTALRKPQMHHAQTQVAYQIPLS